PRLIDQEELAERKRLAQVACKAYSRAHFAVDGIGEEMVRAATLGPGAMQRHVRLPDKNLGPDALGTAYRDADAGGGADGVAAYLVGLRHDIQHRTGGRFGILLPADL